LRPSANEFNNELEEIVIARQEVMRCLKLEFDALLSVHCSFHLFCEQSGLAWLYLHVIIGIFERECFFVSSVVVVGEFCVSAVVIT